MPLKREYIEGTKALENFEHGMTALFKVPKDKVVKAEKKQQKKASSLRKQKRADRD
jgi:hypothetical protein